MAESFKMAPRCRAESFLGSFFCRVQILEVSILYDYYSAFRLFIPNLPPFCEEEDGTDSNEKLADTLKFIIRQIPLVNESHYADKAWYMIERMAGLKLIHSALAIDEGNIDVSRIYMRI